MLKIHSFLRQIKDTIGNLKSKVSIVCHKYTALCAYTLSAVVLVFYFGNSVDFGTKVSELTANAAVYVPNHELEETKAPVFYYTGNTEYTLNSPDHDISNRVTPDEENTIRPMKLDTMYLSLYSSGQVIMNGIIRPELSLQAKQMATAAIQDSAKVSANSAFVPLSLFSMEDKDKTFDASTDERADTPKKENVKQKKEAKKESEQKNSTKKESIPASLSVVRNKMMIKQLSAKEKEVLYRIVEAEATGEDIYGKILVANVVLNRVNAEEFPDTISKVVFQKCGSAYQFSPTKDGRYYSVSITESTKEAVNRALSGEDYSQGALYFFARRLTTKQKASWFDSSLRKVVQYGCHEFYAEK